MAEKDDLPKDKKPVELDIPELKKKEKEKKKSGFFWRGGAAPGNAFQGAKGAAGAASSAARGAANVGRAAIGGGSKGVGLFGNLFGRFGGILTNLTATVAGKVALSAAVLLMAGGAALVGVSLLKGSKTAESDPTLGALTSGIAVDRSGDATALNYAAKAGRGANLKFGKTKSEKTAESEKAEAAEATEATEESDMPEGGVDSLSSEETDETGDTGGSTTPRLQGSNLSTTLGGSKFSGKVGKFGDGDLSGKIKKLRAAAPKRGSGGNRVARGISAGRRGMFRGKNPNVRSLGQLRSMSQQNGAVGSQTSTSEMAADAATGQFIGSNITGGEAPEDPDGIDGGGPSGGNNPTVGNPACSITQMEDGLVPLLDGTCGDPGTGPTRDYSPWTSLVDQARSEIQNYLSDMMMYSIIIFIGLIAAAALIIATVCSFSIPGLILLAIVLALALVFVLDLIKKADRVIKLGEQVNERDGRPVGDKLIEVGKYMKTQAWWVMSGLGGIIQVKAVEKKAKDLHKVVQDKLQSDLEMKDLGVDGASEATGATATLKNLQDKADQAEADADAKREQTQQRESDANGAQNDANILRGDYINKRNAAAACNINCGALNAARDAAHDAWQEKQAEADRLYQEASDLRDEQERLQGVADQKQSDADDAWEEACAENAGAAGC